MRMHRIGNIERSIFRLKHLILTVEDQAEIAMKIMKQFPHYVKDDLPVRIEEKTNEFQIILEDLIEFLKSLNREV